MGKKALCLIFAFLLSINSFAAVVSDNDGSAFITKAEFEAMKKDFASQVDQYNTSIDSKIDGAIANYLANVKLGKPTVYDVINRKWKEVTFINGSYPNDYDIPDINYLVGLNGRSYSRGSGTQPYDIRAFDSNFIMSYKRTSGTRNRKNCFLVLEGEEGNPTKLYWRGIAKGYREIINCSIQNGITGSNFSAFCWGDSDYLKRVLCNYPLKCKGASYAVAYNTKVFDVTVMPQAKAQPSGSWYDATSGVSDLWNKALTKFNIELDYISGAQYDTDHIIGWSKDTEWELYCPNWKNTWQLSSNQTINDLTMYNSVTRHTDGWYAGQEGGDVTPRQASGSMPFTFVNSSSSTGNYFYSVGLYATPVENKKIYQLEKGFQYTSSDTFDVDNLTIEKGLPIAAAKAEDIVELEPIIKTVKCYNESGSYVTNQNEVDIYLSYVPFTEKDTTTNPIKIEQPDKSKEAYTTTTERKAKIKFEMDKKSLIYMQMKPHFPDGATIGPNSMWEIVLDFTGDGGTYIITSPIS